MTFEEFKKLALNPPFTQEPSVYRMDIFRIVKPYAEDDYYSKYGVRKSESFMFPSIEEAIHDIESKEISKNNENPIHSIRIYELPFGKNVNHTCCKREWVFDSDGTLKEQSVCSLLTEDLDTPEGHFWGRPKDSIRFKPGDIVEVLDMDNMEVRLAIVLSLPNDIESCWEEYLKVIESCKREGIGEENADDNYWLYACDDCYCIVYDSASEYGTSSSYTTNVFAPRFHITANLKNRLYDYYKKLLRTS